MLSHIILRDSLLTCSGSGDFLPLCRQKKTVHCNSSRRTISLRRFARQAYLEVRQQRTLTHDELDHVLAALELQVSVVRHGDDELRQTLLHLREAESRLKIFFRRSTGVMCDKVFERLVPSAERKDRRTLLFVSGKTIFSPERTTSFFSSI